MSETTAPSTPANTPNEGVKLVQPKLAEPEPVTEAQPVSDVYSSPESAPSPGQRRATPLGELTKYAISAVILTFGALVMYGLYLSKQDVAKQETKQLIPMVGTVEAQTYAGELDRVVSGTVVPYREIRVAAEVNGNIVATSEVFEAGNMVKKGDLLLEIDRTDYDLMLKTGNAEVAQASKMLEETKTEIAGADENLKIAIRELALADKQLKRDQNLFNQGAIVASELEQTERTQLAADSAKTARQNTLNMLQARVQRMQSALELSQAQLERTKLNLQKTKIYAPNDGVIVREMVQKGDFVRAGDQLVTIEDTSRSEVICNLTPTDLEWVRSNAPASSKIDLEENPDHFSVYYIPKTEVKVYESGDTNLDEEGKPRYQWAGVLERFDGIGRDESTRTIPCRITIKQPVIVNEDGPRALVRGMYVKCRIEVQTSTDRSGRNFLKVPAVAVRPGNIVWVVRNRNSDEPTLEKLEVEVVDYIEDFVDSTKKKFVVIAEGSVKPGDEIVRTPLSQPSDGAVVIIEGSDAAKALNDSDAEADAESESP